MEIAVDGPTGLRRIEELHPDGVLLDLLLPGMNGIHLLKKIRSQKQFGQLPVVVFSNAYVVNMVQDAIEAGATVVFNKAATTPREIAEALHGALSPLEAAEFATRVGAAQVPAAGNPAFADSSAKVPPPAGLSPELTPVPPSVNGQNHASGDGLPAGDDKSGQFKLRAYKAKGQEAEIIATGIPPSNDLESAIVETLPASGAAYTAIVRGVNDTTGVALIEVYGLSN